MMRLGIPCPIKKITFSGITLHPEPVFPAQVRILYLPVQENTITNPVCFQKHQPGK